MERMRPLMAAFSSPAGYPASSFPPFDDVGRLGVEGRSNASTSSEIRVEDEDEDDLPLGPSLEAPDSAAKVAATLLPLAPPPLLFDLPPLPCQPPP